MYVPPVVSNKRVFIGYFNGDRNDPSIDDFILHSVDDMPANFFYSQNSIQYSYWRTGQCHRETGPATCSRSVFGANLRDWWIHNHKPHNLYGPASVSTNVHASDEYWIHGRSLDCDNVLAFMKRHCIESLEALRNDKALESAFMLEVAC